MSNETPADQNQDQDLDTFSSEFFQLKAPETVEDESSEKEDPEVKIDANEEDTQTEEDTLVEDDSEEEAVAELPKKKTRFQERIDELTAKAREAERREALLQERLTELEKKDKKPEVTTPAVITDGPTPEDLDDDGNEKYPLGEFDPKYIRDLTKFSFRQELEQSKLQEAQEAQQKTFETQKAALQQEWVGKVETARERYPDLVEKGQALEAAFNGIDQPYADYLVATIQSMDFGVDVLYHLANNVDDARKIVEAGPTRATIALGRLEAKFADDAETKQRARPKVSNAPTPPPHSNKGSAVSMPEVEDTTDDLDAFAAKFFKKRR